jgi:flagellar L-ring protein precursor FlgH
LASNKEYIMNLRMNFQPARIWRGAACLLGALLLSQLTACVSVRAPIPSSIVAKPTTATPVAASYAPPANGAIFQTGGYRGLFEDARARRIGDTITITISENTSTVKAAASSGSKTGSFAVTQAPSLGVFKSFGSNAIKGSTSNSFADKDAESASNTFTGSLTVTITEVLPNGNFKVAGEKQLALDKGAEFIRLSGVVNPGTLTASNTVTSSQVADARIEYRTNSQIDQASFTQMLSRMFLSVLPF